MDEKFLDYMTKTEYASEYPGVVKNAEYADNAIKLGGNESTYYASAATMNEVLKTANGAQSTATAAQALASEAKLDAAAAKSAADNAQATANACIPKNDITEVTGEFTTKVMSQKATTEQLNLCMKKADYDSDGDGVVERADEAIRAESAALADNALKLNGKTETELSVGNAEKLEGKPLNDFVRKGTAEHKTFECSHAGISGQYTNLAWNDGNTIHVIAGFYGSVTSESSMVIAQIGELGLPMPKHRIVFPCNICTPQTKIAVSGALNTDGNIVIFGVGGTTITECFVQFSYPVGY